MRALVSIVLSLLLLQSAGPIFFLQLQQRQIRREMKRAIRAGLPEEKLRRFVMEADGRFADGRNVEWFEAREFRHNGVMYDVARRESDGDRTVLFCVRDDAETALYARLDRLVREESNSNPERRREASRLMKHLLQPVLPPNSPRFDTEIVAISLPRPATPAPLRAVLPPPTPPPEA